MAIDQERLNQQAAQGQSQTQARTAEEEQKQKDAAGGAEYCKFCHELLSPDSDFCPNCGEKNGGEEFTCVIPSCRYVTTKYRCPKCNGSYTCPKCKITSVKPVCSVCGAILDKSLNEQIKAQEQTEEMPQVKQMAQEQSQKIEQRLKALEESHELKKIQKRILEREQLLFERAYYNKMQKEIVEVFGARPFTVEVPSAEEQAAMQRIFASLHRTIIDKNRKATQAELEAMFPELRHVHEAENKAAEEQARAEEELQQKRLEQEKKFREMEEKYRSILENIDSDIQEAKDSARKADEAQKEAERQRLLTEKAEREALLKREQEAMEKAAREAEERRARIAAEEKAKAEAKARAEAEERARAQAAADQRAAAERQRQMEEARRQAQLREEARNRLGAYYYHGNDQKFTLILDTDTYAICKDYFGSQYVYSEHEVKKRGSRITIKETSKIPINFGMADRYEGEFNKDGTVITGNWIHRGGQKTYVYTYYKIQ